MDDNTQQASPIRFFEMVGIGRDEMKNYTVRLNSNKYIDVFNLYYSNRQEAMEWIFTRKWSGKDASGNIYGKALQFIQTHDGRWLFVGAFSTTGEYRNAKGDQVYYYEEDLKFKSYADRTIVSFARNAGLRDLRTVYQLSSPRTDWCTRFWNDLTVSEISERGMPHDPFPGYSNVSLSLPELQTVLSFGEWQGALRAVSAIYLQTDRANGWHYVGSAYGDGGLLGRWNDYAWGDHTGGNKLLKELVAQEGEEYISNNFQYSILEVFNPAIDASTIIRREHWWMETLGSVRDEKSTNPHGYNTGKQYKNTGEGKDAGAY
ncbi:GIY-YIG nuclease family protein [Bifidobacterium choloepi]|uniref:GIY-YIG nuclease family protein n=1 Tax=Bifidobacterium choloepi TaxID=2614131 RepID=A0A6I5N0I8_9BIFI|nr:GIY-YIG nuclease family protein [Bifidobacterium choloepi]NEG69169.1 GIY-YIG nuclease family protein [Bifidobacterium choloepi]